MYKSGLKLLNEEGNSPKIRNQILGTVILILLIIVVNNVITVLYFVSQCKNE